VNTEEQQLADMLHRITPEPPRRVTVEQVAYRLVSEPRLSRQTRGRARSGRGPRPRRGGLSRAWAPAMAAAAVVVIAGASAGLAVLASSHHNPPSAAGGTPASSSVSSAPASSSPSQSSAEQTTPTTALASGPWAARLISRQTFNQGSLVSGDGSLYAFGTGTLDRIDPATGAVTATARYNPPLANPPVVVGNTVWVVWSYGGGNVVLHGYDAQTLAQTASVLVPATGPVSSSASNVLTAGPDGHLYVAAGVTVVVENPDGQLIRRIYLTAGTANSVAVSPDGNTMYVGVSPAGGGFKVLVYNLSSDTVVTSSSLQGTDSGGNLVATSGGVWGTTGTGMSEWTWFAPHGELNFAVRVGAGAGGGYASLPSYNGGVVWIGGSHTLTCANPATGRVLDTATLPTDHSVVEYFGTPAVLGDHAYSVYQDNASQLSGLVRMTPPAACSGLSSLFPVEYLGKVRRHLLREWRRTRRRPLAERPPAQLPAVVRGEPAGQVRPGRDDLRRVQPGVHLVVVLLGLAEVDRVAEPGGLEQVPGVGPQHRHLGELVPVALEVAVVDRVEPDQRGPQPHVRLGDRVAHQVPAGGQPLGQPVQPGEQGPVGVVVGGLRGGEPAPVHAVVHVPVDTRADLLDLVTQPLGVQVGGARPVQRRPLVLQVEGDPPEVGGHHRPGRDVHDGRDGHTPVVPWHRPLVGLTEPVDGQHRVEPARVQVERPAPPVMHRPADAHAQHRLEPEQPPDDHRPVRPRARPRHHKPVPPGLHREGPVPPVRRDPPVQVPGIPDELSRASHAADATRPAFARTRPGDQGVGKPEGLTCVVGAPPPLTA
jgi:hypothetical protein